MLGVIGVNFFLMGWRVMLVLFLGGYNMVENKMMKKIGSLKGVVKMIR